jgi:membrane associated rhomboid family serine protease
VLKRGVTPETKVGSAGRKMRAYRAYSSNVIWFLIIANLVVFIMTLVRSDMGSFLALLPYPYFLSQPWGIITHMFVHANFWHILCNMISLYFLGSLLIRLIGENKFLTVYFLGGIIGGLFYVFVLPPLKPAVGASGAIFALGGALAIMAPRLPVFMFFVPIPVPLWIAILVFLLISFIPGIAWQAHLGGLLLGLGAGYYYKKKRRVYF